VKSSNYAKVNATKGSWDRWSKCSSVATVSDSLTDYSHIYIFTHMHNRYEICMTHRRNMKEKLRNSKESAVRFTKVMHLCPFFTLL